MCVDWVQGGTVIQGMGQTLLVDLPGRVRSKSNYRFDRRGGWAELRRFEEEVAWAARSALPDGWPSDDPDVWFVMVILAGTALDTANLPKSITDALEDVVYPNDRQVRWISCSALPHPGGGVVAAAPVPPFSDLETMESEARRLFAAALGRLRETVEG